MGELSFLGELPPEISATKDKIIAIAFGISAAFYSVWHLIYCFNLWQNNVV